MAPRRAAVLAHIADELDEGDGVGTAAVKPAAGNPLPQAGLKQDALRNGVGLGAADDHFTHGRIQKIEERHRNRVPALAQGLVAVGILNRPEDMGYDVARRHQLATVRMFQPARSRVTSLCARAISLSYKSKCTLAPSASIHPTLLPDMAFIFASAP